MAVIPVPKVAPVIKNTYLKYLLLGLEMLSLCFHSSGYFAYKIRHYYKALQALPKISKYTMVGHQQNLKLISGLVKNPMGHTKRVDVTHFPWHTTANDI